MILLSTHQLNFIQCPAQCSLRLLLQAAKLDYLFLVFACQRLDRQCLHCWVGWVRDYVYVLLAFFLEIYLIEQLIGRADTKASRTH